MEILNYLSDMASYQSGLVAESLNEVIRAPQFIDTIILDNEKMLSDAHTFYIVDLMAVLHPDKKVLTLIQEMNGHEMLARILSKKSYEMINQDLEYWDEELTPLPKKWRLIKRHKENKKQSKDFMNHRVILPQKVGLIQSLKNRLKGEET